MKKIILIISLVFLVACNGAWNMENLLPQPKESICNTIPEGESFICERLRNPEFVHSIIYISNAAMLDSMSLSEIEKETKVVNEVIWWLGQEDLTYAAFQKIVMEKAGSLLALAVSQQLNMFQFNNNPILKADRDMMLWSLNQTLGLIEIAKNQHIKGV